MTAATDLTASSDAAIPAPVWQTGPNGGLGVRSKTSNSYFCLPRMVAPIPSPEALSMGADVLVMTPDLWWPGSQTHLED